MNGLRGSVKKSRQEPQAARHPYCRQSRELQLQLLSETIVHLGGYDEYRRPSCVQVAPYHRVVAAEIALSSKLAAIYGQPRSLGIDKRGHVAMLRCTRRRYDVVSASHHPPWESLSRDSFVGRSGDVHFRGPSTRSCQVHSR